MCRHKNIQYHHQFILVGVSDANPIWENTKLRQESPLNRKSGYCRTLCKEAHIYTLFHTQEYFRVFNPLACFEGTRKLGNLEENHEDIQDSTQTVT